MKEIVVIGGGGHGKSVIGAIKKLNQYKIVGYVAPNDEGNILGVVHIGTDNDLLRIRDKFDCYEAVIGVGNVSVSDKRHRIREHMESNGFVLPTIIASTAIINEEVIIGKGTFVLDGVIINVGSKIGECCIINTGAIIDHDCEIGDFVHVASGVTLSGCVKVGDNSMIGTGASVIQGRVIGSNCMIGASAVVVSDCLEEGTYVGVPARK